MARGTFSVFNRTKLNILDKKLDFDTDTFEIGFTTHQVGSTATISDTTANPTWGTAGTTDLSSSEVSGTGYSAHSLGSPTILNTGDSQGTKAFDTANPSTWSQNGAGPTNIKCAIIYKSTGDKEAIGYMDMTSDGVTAISQQDGDITVTVDANGWFTLA